MPAVFGAAAAFRFRFMIKKIAMIVTQITATPPTVPPTMAPMFVDEEDVGVGVGVLLVVVLAVAVVEEDGVVVEDEGVGVGPEYDAGYWVPVESPFSPVNVGTSMGPVWPL